MITANYRRESEMTRSEILEFVKKNTTSFMSTIDDGEPRVRGMDTAVVDEKGLTFLTGANKDVCRELLADPSVELCYWTPGEGIQLRLRGKLEKLDDEELKRNIVENRFTFLKPIAEQYGWEAFVLFRLASGTGRIWAAKHPAGGNDTFEF